LREVTRLLLQGQQLVGAHHVEQAAVAVGLRGERGVGALEVLPEQTEVHLAFG